MVDEIIYDGVLSPDVEEMNRVIDEQSFMLVEKLNISDAEERSELRRLHREVSEFDKKDALLYEVAMYRKKYDSLKREYTARLDSIKTELKKFYIKKIEQRKETIKQVYMNEFKNQLKQNSKLVLEAKKQDRVIAKLKQFLVSQEQVCAYINACRGSYRYDISEMGQEAAEMLKTMYPEVHVESPVIPQRRQSKIGLALTRRPTLV